MATPLVSVVLPTYNRERFLPQAFASIQGQTLAEWELIVVDDGSTDNTRGLVEAFQASVAQPVYYIHQENQGAYIARNTGLAATTGRYVAFYDSDDIWLPHHLNDCVAALDRHPDVDWAYAACRIVDYRSGRELAPSTFYLDGRPRPFLALRCITDGSFRIIDDPRATECMIRHGLLSGLQNSVIRQRVFDGRRFEAARRNGEDQMIVIRALADGRRFGYLDNVHVVYHTHDQNSSAPDASADLDKQLAVHTAMASGFEELLDRVSLTASQTRAVRQRLVRTYFWVIGYALLWQHGRRAEALAMFRRGLACWPWSLRCWKTYWLARLRVSRPFRSGDDTPDQVVATSASATATR